MKANLAKFKPDIRLNISIKVEIKLGNVVVGFLSKVLQSLPGLWTALMQAPPSAGEGAGAGAGVW